MQLLWILPLVGLTWGDITGERPSAGDCLCFYANGVRVRDSACGGIIGSADTGRCVVAAGNDPQWCTLSGTPYEFHSFQWGGQTGWSAGNFLQRAEASRCSSGPPPGGNCGGSEVVSRAGWGARPPRRVVPMRTPVAMVFIHHTVTPACFNQVECIAQMQSIQNFHMDSRGWPDIAYSWLVGEDGRVYEGRGWQAVGAHTFGYNSIAVAVSVMGNFQERVPNQAALTAVRNIIACGVQDGFVTSNYELFGHRNGGCTACPGNMLFAEIQTWPEYSNRDIPRYGCGG